MYVLKSANSHLRGTGIPKCCAREFAQKHSNHEGSIAALEGLDRHIVLGSGVLRQLQQPRQGVFLCRSSVPTYRRTRPVLQKEGQVGNAAVEGTK